MKKRIKLIHGIFLWVIIISPVYIPQIYITEGDVKQVLKPSESNEESYQFGVAPKLMTMKMITYEETIYIYQNYV